MEVFIAFMFWIRLNIYDTNLIQILHFAMNFSAKV